MNAADLLGPHLVNGAGERVPQSSLRGKVVALYFSASWSGPCRGFTPQLIATYNALLAAGKPFEIVLIGSDKTQKEFDKYHEGMPWVAVPFEDRVRKQQLSTHFRVSSIPTLVILDKDWNVITIEGRAEIGNDPEGKCFPWRPKPLSELIGTNFMTKLGMIGPEAIEGKALALYLSAQWCPPSRASTPSLVKTYSALKGRGGGGRVEFIFVSLNKDIAGFNKQYREMPWIAIPFDDVHRRTALARRLDFRGMPMLVTVGSDGVIINQKAREDAARDTKGLKFPWPPQAVADLSVTTYSSGFRFQEKPSLVVFMEGAGDSQKEEVQNALLSIAEAEVKARNQAGKPALLFFTAKSVAKVPTEVRKVCDMEAVSEAPQMVIIDIPGKGAYFVPSGGASTPVTSDSIAAFIRAYKEGSLKRSNLTRG